MDDSPVRPPHWQVEQPEPERGDAGTRARHERGSSSGTGTPESPASRAPGTETDGLPSRVRPPHRPGPGGAAARGRVVLSDHDLAVMRKTVAQARLNDKDSQQSSTAALKGTDPGEARPPRGTPRANTKRTWTRRRSMLTGAIILAAMLFCGGALTVTLIHRTAAGNGPLSGGPPPGEAAIAGAAAARTAAAAWVARQVDPAAIIACDPQMCAVLRATGFQRAACSCSGPATLRRSEAT